MLKKLTLWLQMTRPSFLTTSAIACLLGFACAHHAGFQVHTGLALLTTVLAVLLHAATNVLNDDADAQSGADAANHTALAPFSGGLGWIQQGRVTRAQTRSLGYTLLAVVAAGGALLMLLTSWKLLFFGLAGLVLAWTYSYPPLQLMSRGMGELAVACAWVLMVQGAAFVVSGQVLASAFWLGLAMALAVVNILFINCLPDARGDAQVGKRTLVVHLLEGRSTQAGWRSVAALYAAFALLAYAALGVAVSQAHAPPTVWLCLLAAPWWTVAAFTIYRANGHIEKLRTAIVCTILAAHVFGICLIGMLFYR